MYLNFSNFLGQPLAGGKPWSKKGTSGGWGIDKIFAGWGPSPPGKNPGGTQLPFWYECVALRAENKGLENRLPPNLGS